MWTSLSGNFLLNSSRHKGLTATLSCDGGLICWKQPFIFSTQLLVSFHEKQFVSGPLLQDHVVGLRTRGRVARHIKKETEAREGRGRDGALIWLDLAKIPSRDWSAVLVVSQQLMLSLYHGNNLLLKPRKQINYGKDISRRHYRVIKLKNRKKKKKNHLHPSCRLVVLAVGGSVCVIRHLML